MLLEPVLPLASFAIEVMVCVPALAELAFHIKLYGAVVRLPITTPSTLQLTVTTPTLSLADTAIFTLPEMADPLSGDVIFKHCLF